MAEDAAKWSTSANKTKVRRVIIICGRGWRERLPDDSERGGTPVQSRRIKEAEDLNHLFTAVSGVPNQFLAIGVDHEIEDLQGYLAYQHGTVVGYFGNITQAISSLDGQPDCSVHLHAHDASRGSGLPCAKRM